MEEFFRPAWEVFAKEPTVSDTSWQPTLGFPFLHATFSHFELREFPSLYAWCVFSQGIHGDFVFLVILQYIFCQFLLLIVAAFFLYCRDTFCHTPLLYFIFYIFFIITMLWHPKRSETDTMFLGAWCMTSYQYIVCRNCPNNVIMVEKKKTLHVIITGFLLFSYPTNLHQLNQVSRLLEIKYDTDSWFWEKYHW